MTDQGHAPQERGTKSKWLTMAEGGVLDDSPGYEPITQGVPEQGVFRIVGGYLDQEGVLHNEVHLRAMSGHEEDLLGNRSIPVSQRLNGIMAQCIQRIGTITDRGQISSAVAKLPGGSRTHLLISLRRTTHWRATKDNYDMEVRCPACGKTGSYTVNLGDLELFDMPEPTKRRYDVVLPDSGIKVEWKVTSGAEEQVLSVVAEGDKSEAEYLTYAIMVRLVSLDGDVVELGVSDLLNEKHDALQLSANAQKLKLFAKNLSSGDREKLREQFLDFEPGVDTEIELDCSNPKCGVEFITALNVGQASFFFPSATRKRSKRRSST